MNTDNVIKVMSWKKKSYFMLNFLGVLMLPVLCSNSQSSSYSWSQPAIILQKTNKGHMALFPTPHSYNHWLAKIKTHSYTYIGFLIVEV